LERFTETHRRYLAYIEAIVLEMTARDNVVLVGRASTVILARIRQALRVRITAPETVRARRVQQQQGLTPEAALDSVQQTVEELPTSIGGDLTIHDVIDTGQATEHRQLRHLTTERLHRRVMPMPEAATCIRCQREIERRGLRFAA
jgi:hypothetical protein